MIRASFGKSVARSTLLGGLALLAVPAIAGCEAGFNAPTLQYHPAASGAYANVNGISISNAFVLGAPLGGAVPAGSSASVFLGVFNTGSSQDKLVAISAPGTASSVEIKGGSVAVPPNTLAAGLTGPQPSVVLRGLTSELQNGQTVSLALDFAQAGVVTLKAPVEPKAFYYSTYSPPAASPLASPSASAAGTAKPKSGASATPADTASPSPSQSG